MRKKLLKSLVLLLIGTVIVVGSIFMMDEIFGLDNAEKIFDRIGINIKLGESNEIVVPELEVALIENHQNIIEGFTTIVLETNREITIEESSKFNLVLVEERDSKFTYVVEVVNLAFGSSIARFSVFDSEQNEKSIEVQIERIENFSFLGKTVVDAWPDSSYVLNGDELLVYVDKNRRLLNTYAPVDLVNLHEEYVDLYVNSSSFELRAEAANQLNLMLKDMRDDIDKNVVIASAYRSYNTQVKIYSGYVLSGENTRDEVDKFSARPGYSEHQLGTVVDFINEESDFKLTEAFDNTAAGKWLLENSWKYGFIQTYPKGSETKTDYNYEAWHYRFIGVENSTAMRESGMIFVDWVQSI